MSGLTPKAKVVAPASCHHRLIKAAGGVSASRSIALELTHVSGANMGNV
jgi:hypothetical protein